MLIKKINKLSALFTAVFYLTTSAGFAQPAASVSVSPRTSPEIPVIQGAIHIPESMGSIQAQHQSGKDSPGVIFIQDAHSVTNAQNHIREIIRHLQQTYGIRVIALEGAAGAIDPTLIRTFPDAFIKQRVLADYLKRGELTGAEMAAALNPAAGTYYGLEDWNLYQEHYLAYLKAVEKQEVLFGNLQEAREQLDRQRQKVYSARSNEFHDKLRAFEKENTYLLELLNYLATVEGAKQKLGRYPDLEKLYRSFEFEKETEKNKGDFESKVRQMADRFKAKYVKQMNIKQQMMFHRNYQLFVTGQIDTGKFLQYLIAAGESFGVKARLTPAMLKVLGHCETLGTIKGTKLFGELENLIREIEAVLITTPQERAIAENYRRLKLLEALGKLELTREQWEEIQAYSVESRTDSELLNATRYPLDAKFFAPAFEFYRLALKRDKSFSQNLAKLLKKEKAKAAIVVAGGFHTEGFERNLKEEGYSYTVVTPKIQSLEGQERYAEVMRGKLSYGPQFKTTFYDAFIKHSSAKLMNEFNESDFRKNIKLWRDEIIRKLSSESRMSEANEYLRYLDLLLNAYNEKFESGTRFTKSREEILKAVENELTQFKKETLSDLWRRFDFQIKEFSAGLKSLVDRKELSAQNISSLLDHAGQVRPSTLGAPLALVNVGFDSPDLIFWQNTGRLPAYSSRAEVKQKLIMPDGPSARSERRAPLSPKPYISRAEMRTDNVELARQFYKKLLKRLAAAGALEITGFWQFPPTGKEPGILKIETGQIPDVKASNRSRSEIRNESEIPAAAEVYEHVIQADEFLSRLTLEQALVESEKVDLLFDQEQSRVIPYIGHHLTDRGRAVQLVLEKVMDRLMNAPEMDSEDGHIDFARISLFPATYKQIGGDNLANRFKELMLEAFRSGSYFAGGGAYADGAQLVVLDVPIDAFREKYPQIWNDKIDQLILEFRDVLPDIDGNPLLESLRTKHYAAYSVIRLPDNVDSKNLKPPVDEQTRYKKYREEGMDPQLIPILVEDEYAWDYRKWLRAKLKEARLDLKKERQKLLAFERKGQIALAKKAGARIEKAYDQVAYYAQRVTLAADMESVARVEAVEKMPASLKEEPGFNQWLLTATNIKDVRDNLRTKRQFTKLGEFYRAFILGRDRLIPPGEFPSGRIPRLRHMVFQLLTPDSPYSLTNVREAWNDLKEIPDQANLRKFQAIYMQYRSVRNEMIVRADRDVRMPGMEGQASDPDKIPATYTPYFLYKEAFLNEIYDAARNGSLRRFKQHLAGTGFRNLAESISETLILGKRSIGDEIYGAVLVSSDNGQGLSWLPLAGEYDGFNAWNKQYPPDKEDHMDEVFHRGVELALSDERARRAANGPASLREVRDFLQAWTENMRKPGKASKPFVRTVKFYSRGKNEEGTDFERMTLYKKRGSDLGAGPLFARGADGRFRSVDYLSWKVGDTVPEYDMPDRTEPVETQISATFTVDEESLGEGENLMSRILTSLEKWNDFQKKMHGEDGLSGKAATVKQVEKMAGERGMPLPAVRSEVRDGRTVVPAMLEDRKRIGNLLQHVLRNKVGPIAGGIALIENQYAPEVNQETLQNLVEPALEQFEEFVERFNGHNEPLFFRSKKDPNIIVNPKTEGYSDEWDDQTPVINPDDLSEIAEFEKIYAALKKSAAGFRSQIEGVKKAIQEANFDRLEKLVQQMDLTEKELFDFVRDYKEDSLESLTPLNLEKENFIHLLHLLNEHWWLIQGLYSPHGNGIYEYNDKMALQFKGDEPDSRVIRKMNSEEFNEAKKILADIVHNRIELGKLEFVPAGHIERMKELLEKLQLTIAGTLPVPQRAEVRTAPAEDEPEPPTTASLDEVMAARKAVEDRSQAVRNIRHGLLADSNMGRLFKMSENFKEGLIKNLELFANDPSYPVENYFQFFTEKFEVTGEMIQDFRRYLNLGPVVRDYFDTAYSMGRRYVSQGTPWSYVFGYLIKKMHAGRLLEEDLLNKEEERLSEMGISEAWALIKPFVQEEEGASSIDKATAKYIADSFGKMNVRILLNMDQSLRAGQPLMKTLEGPIKDALKYISFSGETDFEIEYDRSEIRKNIRMDLDAIDLSGFLEGKEKEIETLITREKGNGPSVDFYLRSEIRKRMGRDIGGALGRVNTRILKRFRRESAEFPLEVIKESLGQEGVEIAEEKIQRLQERIAFAAKRPKWFGQDALSFVSANRIPNANRIYSVDQALSRLLSEVMPKDQMNTLGSDIPEFGLTPAEIGEAFRPFSGRVNQFYAAYSGKAAIRQKDLPFPRLSFIKINNNPAKELSEIMGREANAGGAPLLFTAVGGMDLSRLDDRLRQNVVELPVAKTDMPLILKQRAIRWGAELLMIRGELLKQNPDFLKPEVFKNYLEKYHPDLAALAQSFSVQKGFLRAEVRALVEQFTTEKLLGTQA